MTQRPFRWSAVWRTFSRRASTMRTGLRGASAGTTRVSAVSKPVTVMSTYRPEALLCTETKSVLSASSNTFTSAAASVPSVWRHTGPLCSVTGSWRT